MLILISFCLLFLVPQVAVAFNIFRGPKSESGLVVKAPERLTRPLGPSAPIAQIWLLRQASKFERIVRRTAELKQASSDVGKQREAAAVRQEYRRQAQAFRRRTRTLETKRAALAKELAKKKLEWDEYKGRVVAIQGMINALNDTAARLDNQANSLPITDIISLFDNRAAKNLLNKTKNRVFQEIAVEIDAAIDPALISTFMAGDSRDTNDVIDSFINGDIERVIKQKELEKRPDIKDLRQRIRDQIKSGAYQDIDFLEENWEVALGGAINKLVAEADEPAPEDPTGAPEYNPKDGPIYEGTATFDDVFPVKSGQIYRCPQQVRVVIQLQNNGLVSGRFYSRRNYPIVPVNGCVDMQAKLWPITGTFENGFFEAETSYRVELTGSYAPESLSGRGRGLLSTALPDGRYFVLSPFTLTKR